MLSVALGAPGRRKGSKKMRFATIPLIRVLLVAGMMSFLILQPGSASAHGFHPGGFVYVMTNQDSGNSVVMFRRAANGTLTHLQDVSTHGLGSGGTNDPLASQGSLVLSSDGRLLFAVNAGSNEISVLGLTPDGLQFLSKTA